MSKRTIVQLGHDELPLAQDDHGVIRVGGTRVSLDSLLSQYLNGASPEQIVDSFPSLSLAEVHAAIAFFLRHRSEIEVYLDEGRKEAEEIERETRATFPTAEFRERLLRRLATSPAGPQK